MIQQGLHMISMSGLGELIPLILFRHYQLIKSLPSSAEMFIILVLGSVPTLKPLYDRLTKMPQSYPSKYLLQRKDVEYSSNGSPVRPGTSAYSRPRYGHENLWDDGDTDNDTRLNSIKVHRSFDVHLDKNKKPRLQPKMEEIGRQPVVTRDVV